MRYKRYKQMNITHIIPKNKISQELEGISAILDANPRIVERAYEDLTKGCNADNGREGMTAEQVVRSAILKQYRNLNYEELSFHLEDSNAFRAFARLGMSQYPCDSVLQENIKELSAETWESMNPLTRDESRVSGLWHSWHRPSAGPECAKRRLRY